MNNLMDGNYDAALESNRFMVKVYNWMVTALAISGGVAYYIGTNMEIFKIIAPFFIPLIILELVVVFTISWAINRISANAAILLFLLYALINGLTLSVIFLVYSQTSIANAFLITAGTFGFMSFYGYTTKTDLSSFGNIMFMGLIGLLIAMAVNWFLKSSVFNLIISSVGVLVFTGLTAYDTQKIKEMNIIGNEGTDEDKKEAVMGALTLYLDFINLFLYLLRLFGSRD